VDAELVLEAPDTHVLITLVQEHAQPAGVRGPLLGPGKDEADLGAAVGDEAFDAVEAPCPVRLLRRLELDVLQVAAGLGFGERHRPRDLAAGESGQVVRLDLVRGEPRDGLGDVLEAEDVHQRRVGARDHLDDHQRDGDREVQTPVRARQRDAHEVGLTQKLEGGGDAGGVADLAVGEDAAGTVDVLGARGDGIRGELARDLERAPVRVDRVLVVAWGIGEVPCLGVVVLTPGDDAGQVEPLELGDEVRVVAVETGHQAPPCAALAAPTAPLVR